MIDEQLSGGNMNTVWKAGDSVRRPAGPWSPTIQRLLFHVRVGGADFVPEPRGFDDQGREMLSFVTGEVPAYPMPDWVWTDAFLQDAAVRLRELHDASVDFAKESALWQLPSRDPAEVICHNDFAPYNFVCNSGRLTGIIDFDTATPGPRVWDLAYLAYRLCPLAAASNHDARRNGVSFPVVEQHRRLDVLLLAYGADFSTAETIETAIRRLDDLTAFSEQQAIASGRRDLADHAALYRTDAAALRLRRR